MGYQENSVKRFEMILNNLFHKQLKSLTVLSNGLSHKGKQ